MSIALNATGRAQAALIDGQNQLLLALRAWSSTTLSNLGGTDSMAKRR
jgi:hypothetical protein